MRDISFIFHSRSCGWHGSADLQFNKYFHLIKRAIAHIYQIEMGKSNAHRISRQPYDDEWWKVVCLSARKLLNLRIFFLLAYSSSLDSDRFLFYTVSIKNVSPPPSCLVNCFWECGKLNVEQTRSFTSNFSFTYIDFQIGYMVTREHVICRCDDFSPVLSDR